MPTLRFPVRGAGKPRQAECFWAAPPAHAEVAILKSWSNLTGNPAQMDAGEMAVLAAGKWKATCEFGTTAKSLLEMESKIHEDPKAEVTAMLLAGADWFEPGLLGVCLFHRTWANNVFLDFLAAHPATMNPSRRVSGVGTGLLHRLSETALHLKSEIMWIETTSGSAPFYEQVFQLRKAGDVLAISREQRDDFRDSARGRWFLSGAS